MDLFSLEKGRCWPCDRDVQFCWSISVNCIALVNNYACLNKSPWFCREVLGTDDEKKKNKAEEAVNDCLPSRALHNWLDVVLYSLCIIHLCYGGVVFFCVCVCVFTHYFCQPASFISAMMGCFFGVCVGVYSLLLSACVIHLCYGVVLFLVCLCVCVQGIFRMLHTLILKHIFGALLCTVHKNIHKGGLAKSQNWKPDWERYSAGVSLIKLDHSSLKVRSECCENGQIQLRFQSCDLHWPN